MIQKPYGELSFPINFVFFWPTVRECLCIGFEEEHNTKVHEDPSVEQYSIVVEVTVSCVLPFFP